MVMHLSPREEIAVAVLLSALLGAALAILCLLNLPYFYELDRPGTIITALITWIGLGCVAFLSMKWLVQPFYSSYSERGNIWFLSIFSLVILATIKLSSPYLWNIPELQHIAVCYIPASRSGEIKVLDMYDTQNGRQYPPQAVGYQQYPITIAAKGCIKGEVIALVGTDPREALHGLGALVDARTAEDSLRISINSQSTTLPLGNHSASANTETVASVAGAAQSLRLNTPWTSTWLKAARWLSTALGSGYLALVLFGITERILSGGGQSWS